MNKQLEDFRRRLNQVFFGPAYHPADHNALIPRGTARGVRAVLLVVGGIWLLMLTVDLVGRFGERAPKSWRYFQGPREINRPPNITRRQEFDRDDLVRIVAVAAATEPYLRLEDKTPTFIATDAQGFRRVRAQAPYDAVLCGDSFSDNNNFADSLAANTGLKTRNLAITARGALTMARYLTAKPTGVLPKTVFWVSAQRANVGDYEILDTLRYQLLNPRILTPWQESLAWPANLDMYLCGTSALTADLSTFKKRVKWQLLHESVSWILLGRQNLPAGQAPMLFFASEEAIRPDPTTPADLAVIADQIARISQELAARGQLLIFAVAPEKSNIYRERLPAGLTARDNYIPSLNKELRARGVRVVDFSVGLRQAALTRPEKLVYYTTDTHWTPAGQGIAARIMADSLARWRVGVTTQAAR